MAKKKAAAKPDSEEDLDETEEVLEDGPGEVIPVVEAPPPPDTPVMIRDWRDVERLREIRELKRLVDEDTDFDTLFPPRPMPTVKPPKPVKAPKPPKVPKAAKVAPAPVVVAAPVKAEVVVKPKAATQKSEKKAKSPSPKKIAKKPAKKSGGLMKALRKALKPKNPAKKKKR